ncbi:MAG: acyltransferase family protein [Pyrinomonadaceae bacterium]
MSTHVHRRIPSLDGLRAVSIILVIASHVLLGMRIQPAANIGDLGVRIFFVISGFLITGIIAGEMQANGRLDLLRFYYRRTLRIFPPYYFFLLVLAALAMLGKVLITARQLLPALTYTSDYIYPEQWDIDHAWSLSVEEQFYLIFPGILAFVGPRKMTVLLGLVLVLCPVLRVVDHSVFADLQPIWLTKGFHANLDTLAAGCLLALLRNRLHSSSSYMRLLNSRLLIALPPLIFLINSQIDYTGQNLGVLYSANNLLMALMIDRFVTRSSDATGRLLNWQPMVIIGMMSYSIYLWQQPFLNPETPSRLFTFPLNILGFTACVLISYFVVERYSLRLRKRYERELFTETREPAVA